MCSYHCDRYCEQKLKTSKYLYGFFGPGLKSIEVFNNMILYCKKLQNNEYFFYKYLKDFI